MPYNTAAPTADMTRGRILNAVLELAQEGGALTVDNVAKRSGVSKGGLLYHFSSKDELLWEAVTLSNSAIEIEFENRVSAGEPLARAALRTIENKLAVAAIALIAEDRPSLAALALGRRQRMEERLTNHGMRVDRAKVLCLALDGLLTQVSLGVVPTDDDFRRLERVFGTMAPRKGDGEGA